MRGIADLPDDIEALKRLVLEQQAKLLSREVLIEKLRMELARLKRLHFGRSSEKLSEQIAQLELRLEELEASESTLPIAVPAATQPSEIARPARRPLPTHLPRETVTHAIACACPECGGELRFIGEDVAEII